MMTWLATFSASFLGAWFGVWCFNKKIRFHTKPLSMTYETQAPRPLRKPSYETLAVELAEAREEIRRLVAAMDGEPVGLDEKGMSQ